MLADTDELRKIKTLPLNPEQENVNEIVGVSRTSFIFRASGDHEHRYFTDDGKPFFPGNAPHRGCCHQEQFHLTVSHDGRFAAYDERYWGELTYFVLVDLKTKQRRAIHAYGAFPYIADGRLFFMSDPAFVKTSNLEFRQIEHYALYSFDPKSGAVTMLRRFAGHAEFLNPR